jgi:hypothetical protein
MRCLHCLNLSASLDLSLHRLHAVYSAFAWLESMCDPRAMCHSITFAHCGWVSFARFACFALPSCDLFRHIAFVRFILSHRLRMIYFIASSTCYLFCRIAFVWLPFGLMQLTLE